MDNTELVSALMTIFKFCTDNQSGCQKTADITEEMGHGANQDTAYMELKTIIEKTFSSVSSCGSQISQIEQELRTVHASLETVKQEAFQADTANVLSRLEKNVASLQEKMDMARQDEITRLTIENQKLTDTIHSLEQEKQRGASEIDALKAQIETIRSENVEIETRLASELSRYEDLKELLTVKECVHSMTETNRTYIERLCEGSELLSLLSLGRDERKIPQLWQYLRDAAVREDADTSRLNAYFEFCINTYNASKPERERYVLRDIPVGSDFDLNLCIKTSDSVQIGKVYKALTRCVMRGGAVMYKAVVTVR